VGERSGFNRQIIFWPLAFAFTVLFAVLCTIATDNHYMVRAFDTDESGKLFELYKMFSEGSWQPLTYLYGTAHTYLALLLSHLYALFKSPSFLEVAVIGRAINFAALLLTGLLFTRWGRCARYPRWLLLFLVTLFFAPLNFTYAFNAKPEHLQGLFIAASLFSLRAFFASPQTGRVLSAGFFAGLAFATKYAGAHLLALETACLLWFVVFAPQLTRRVKYGACWLGVLLAGALGGVALLGPYLIIDYAKVASLLYNHSRVLGAGFLYVGLSSGFDWLRILTRRELLWWPLALWLLPLAAWGASRSSRDTFAAWRELPVRYVDLLWVVAYLAYLCLSIREMNARFLLVIVPFLFDLLFAGLGAIDERLRERGLHIVAHGCFLIIFATTLFAASGSLSIIDALRQRPQAPRIQAGEWLSAHIDHTRLVAYDFYTYVPPEFTRRYHQPYLTAYDVISTQPAFLVISRTIMQRYLDSDRAKHYREGRDAYMRHYYLYAKLSTDSFPGYALLKDFGEVRIYQNNRMR
jgi:hypothetical protein